MKRKIIALLILLISVLFGVSQNALEDVADQLDPPKAGFARVTEVVDGDTIEVLFGESREKVRLIGVDTPETHHPNKGVQCFGQEASNYLTDLLEGAEVRLEADPTNTNRDRYDRLLRYVYMEDDTLVNQKIIEDGYGFAYLAFPFEKSTDFEASFDAAQRAEKGLWSACDVEEDDGYFNTEEV